MEIKNGVLRGDLVCDKSCRIANCGPSLKIYGNVLIKGNLKVVPALTVYGTMIVQGKIDAERSITVEKELKVSSLSMINGNLICDTLTLLSDIGDVNVLAAHTSMDLDGLLGNITARMINSQGSIYCDGRLIVTGSIQASHVIAGRDITSVMGSITCSGYITSKNGSIKAMQTITAGRGVKVGDDEFIVCKNLNGNVRGGNLRIRTEKGKTDVESDQQNNASTYDMIQIGAMPSRQ